MCIDQPDPNSRFIAFSKYASEFCVILDNESTPLKPSRPFICISDDYSIIKTPRNINFSDFGMENREISWIHVFNLLSNFNKNQLRYSKNQTIYTIGQASLDMACKLINCVDQTPMNRDEIECQIG